MLEMQETQNQVLVMMSSPLSAAHKPSLPPNPAPGEATADYCWLLGGRWLARPPWLSHAPSPIPAPAAGGLPADDDDSLVKDRDGGHLAGHGSPALPGASHSDLAGIR